MIRDTSIYFEWIKTLILYLQKHIIIIFMVLMSDDNFSSQFEKKR